MVSAIIDVAISVMRLAMLVALVNLVRPMRWAGVGRAGSALILGVALIANYGLLSLRAWEAGYESVQAMHDARRAREAEAKAAEERAAIEAEAACLEDLDCLADRGRSMADFFCRAGVTSSARYGARWTAPGYAFTGQRWKSRSNAVVTYIAPRGLRLQNGYGAWGQARAECDVHVPSGRVLAVRAWIR